MNRVCRLWWYPTRCSAPHVPRASSDYESFLWRSPREGEPDPRVLRWTCDCQPVVYELVMLGGALFIRRTQTLMGHKVVHETDRWTTSVAKGFWSSLLFGHVR